MFISKLRKRINDTSIAKKLYITIGFTALLVGIELYTLWFSTTTLSAVRSSIGGEGLWSKAQKDAILNLRDYAYSRKAEKYVAFKAFLQVLYGDRMAWVELEKARPDLDKGNLGFLAGKSHPADIDGRIKLLSRFGNVYHLDKAFAAWKDAGPVLDKIVAIGEQLHGLFQKDADQAKINSLLVELEGLNAQLNKLENDFSFALAEGARWLEQLILKLVLALSFTIGLSSVIVVVSINKNLKRGVYAIINSANAIKNGALKTKIPIYGKDEIGMVAIAFNDMADTMNRYISDLKRTEENMLREKHRAERSEKAKQHFLTNMSHEMRTPLNAILGFSQYLEKSGLSKDQEESVQMIIDSGNHLLVTLNDILDFSRIVTGDIVFANASFSISDVVQHVVALNRVKVAAKGVKMTYQISTFMPEIVYGDAARLAQILTNLLSNAIKFTQKGEITISAVVLKETESAYAIEFGVKDTGIGIPADQQDKIFNFFEQVTNNLTRKFGGTGIGLSIVKHLVALQQGEVCLNSQPNVGTAFYFHLPFKKNKQAPPIANAFPIGGPNLNTTFKNHQVIKVLIVEDNAINQLLVLKLLKSPRYLTSTAENGKVAIAKVMEEEFDIILMDLQMPEVDGYEASSFIRKLDSTKKDIPIIAMTAHTIEGDREKCMDLGMNEYISKPYQARELYEKIDQLLSLSNN